MKGNGGDETLLANNKRICRAKASIPTKAKSLKMSEVDGSGVGSGDNSRSCSNNLYLLVVIGWNAACWLMFVVVVRRLGDDEEEKVDSSKGSDDNGDEAGW